MPMPQSVGIDSLLPEEYQDKYLGEPPKDYLSLDVGMREKLQEFWQHVRIVIQQTQSEKFTIDLKTWKVLYNSGNVDVRVVLFGAKTRAILCSLRLENNASEVAHLLEEHHQILVDYFFKCFEQEQDPDFDWVQKKLNLPEGLSLKIPQWFEQVFYQKRLEATRAALDQQISEVISDIFETLGGNHFKKDVNLFKEAVGQYLRKFLYTLDEMAGWRKKDTKTVELEIKRILNYKKKKSLFGIGREKISVEEIISAAFEPKVNEQILTGISSKKLNTFLEQSQPFFQHSRLQAELNKHAAKRFGVDLHAPLRGGGIDLFEFVLCLEAHIREFLSKTFVAGEISTGTKQEEGHLIDRGSQGGSEPAVNPETEEDALFSNLRAKGKKKDPSAQEPEIKTLRQQLEMSQQKVASLESEIAGLRTSIEDLNGKLAQNAEEKQRRIKEMGEGQAGIEKLRNQLEDMIQEKAGKLAVEEQDLLQEKIQEELCKNEKLYKRIQELEKEIETQVTQIQSLSEKCLEAVKKSVKDQKNLSDVQSQHKDIVEKNQYLTEDYTQLKQDVRFVLRELNSLSLFPKVGLSLASLGSGVMLVLAFLDITKKAVLLDLGFVPGTTLSIIGLVELALTLVFAALGYWVYLRMGLQQAGVQAELERMVMLQPPLLDKGSPTPGEDLRLSRIIASTQAKAKAQDEARKNQPQLQPPYVPSQAVNPFQASSRGMNQRTTVCRRPRGGS